MPAGPVRQQHTMKRILKYLLFLGLGVLFIWTMYFLYQKSASKPDEFAIETLKRNNVVKKTVANGKIVPRKEILIKPVVSGIIAELYVEAGDIVKKDQPLAKIKIVPDMLSLSNAENRLRNSEIAEQNAKLTYDRNKPLADKGVISAAEMQTYDIALKNAKQEVSAAQEALRVKPPQDQVGIRHRCLLPTAAIARWPRHGASTARPHAQAPAIIHIGHTAPAPAHGGVD